MAAQGFPVSIAGLARSYEDFLDILIADLRDAEAARQLTRPGLRVHCTNTIMRNADDKAKLESAIAATKEALKGSDSAAIKSASEKLNEVVQAVSAELYKAGAAQAGKGQPGGQPPHGEEPKSEDPKKDDGVIDAEVVDEKK